MSQDSENHQITSLNFTVITPRLSHNGRNMGFGMLVAGTSVNALQVCSVALVLLCITSLDGTTKQAPLFTHPGRHD